MCPLLSLFLPNTHSLSISLSLLFLLFFLLTSTLQRLHALSFNLCLPLFFVFLLDCFSLFFFSLDLAVAFLLSSFFSCLGCCSSSLFLYLPVPGAMANHLITNALLRPHGTNNPYNTLLGDSAVYNNPAVGMYNTQGVPNVPIMNVQLLKVLLQLFFKPILFILHGYFI